MNLVDIVKEAGVIGAGGAGFPTHAKLSTRAEYVLLNGAECEPLLRVDQQLMADFPEEIIKGFYAAGKYVEAENAIIGIKGKHKKVIEILENKIKELGYDDYVKIGILPDIYPAGDEQVLVYELTGRVVPEAGIPIQVGCVVINSETALNIFNAMNGDSVTEKYLTLAGDIPNRVTIKAPVGTSIRKIFELTGIENLDDYAFVDGGPMMGPILKDVDGHITKKTKGFIILKKHHPLIARKGATKEQAKRINRATCEQCRLCTDLCPRFLLGHETVPHKMMRALNYGLQNREEQTVAQLCCQCNLCEYFSCPIGLFPKSANNFFREILAEEKIKHKPNPNELNPRVARESRMIPSKRLMARIGILKFDKPAPLDATLMEVDEVKIALAQHVGAPTSPMVKVGDVVTKGQMIGNVGEGQLGAPIHSSIDGTVTACDDKFITIRRN